MLIYKFRASQICQDDRIYIKFIICIVLYYVDDDIVPYIYSNRHIFLILENHINY